MRPFRTAHGLTFTATCKMLRAPTGHGVLRDHLDLSVGYSGSVVNQHGLELFLIGPGGSVVTAWTRTVWDPEQVLGEVKVELDG